ncbi:MAG: anaerobic ribonucleoside-triphosphate reductase activating protein [Candidatus Thorarchaeota archaeon]|jgi:pyruvate formate lyase activating enzyme
MIGLELTMRIASIIDISLVDIPGIPVTVLFTAGCNMDCPYCQNAEIIPTNSGDEMTIDAIVQQLRGYLTDGYCITGGEPTIQKELPELLKQLRSEDSKHINLNTQGTVPDVLEKSLPYLDSVWFDIKTIPESYCEVTRVKGDPWPRVEKSIRLVLDSEVSFWPRTTYVGGLTKPTDILKISALLSDIGFEGEYVVQNFIKSAGTREADAESFTEPVVDELASIIDKIPEGISLRLEWR